MNWQNRGIEIEDEYLNNLSFADIDIILNESSNELQIAIRRTKQRKPKSRVED